jgi:hypothetical protein
MHPLLPAEQAAVGGEDEQLNMQTTSARSANTLGGQNVPFGVSLGVVTRKVISGTMPSGPDPINRK